MASKRGSFIQKFYQIKGVNWRTLTSLVPSSDWVWVDLYWILNVEKAPNMLEFFNWHRLDPKTHTLIRKMIYRYNWLSSHGWKYNLMDMPSRHVEIYFHGDEFFDIHSNSIFGYFSMLTIIALCTDRKSNYVAKPWNKKLFDWSICNLSKVKFFLLHP